MGGVAGGRGVTPFQARTHTHTHTHTRDEGTKKKEKHTIRESRERSQGDGVGEREVVERQNGRCQATATHRQVRTDAWKVRLLTKDPGSR